MYGQNLVKVPNVKGMTYADAKSYLIENDLCFISIRNAESKIVLEQSIKEGDVVRKNTIIDLVLKEKVLSGSTNVKKVSGQKIVAIDPGCVGCDFDENIKDPIGPGATEFSRAYTKGGTGKKQE